MYDYEVDKSPPVPAARNDYTRYPFAALEIGDSFLVQQPEDGEVVGHRLQSAARYHRRAYGRRYTVRKMAAGEYRVWRIQ